LKDLHQMAFLAREAFYRIADSSSDTRNKILFSLSDLLRKHQQEIYDANAADTEEAKKSDLALPLLHRLFFGAEKLNQVILSLQSLAELPDPLNRTLFANEITDGLDLYRVTAPIGVIGVIFESRPDALIQISSLCIKSGNAVLLKGGREAFRTNSILCELVRKALSENGISSDTVQLLETREDVAGMLKEDKLIDLIIPRGSNAFVKYIMDNSNIPVLGHADGICHVYIDSSADPDMAVRIAVDSKTQNVSVCNAMETLLVHKDIAPLILSLLEKAFMAEHVEIRGDENAMKYMDCVPAEEKDWSTEYLDYILSVKVVSSLDEAISHINHYGSHHTDCIVTSDPENASLFMRRVDSAGVYWNVSTRFADGFVYGLGAEVGISTGKIHARGPMGLEGLTTYKYKLLGKGHTMQEMKNGTRAYTHRTLNDSCPV